ncbi:hypothetical protein EV356DRAFT_573769 [Viridothelium virens]|uniref:AMIN domain-containing protein n=1 Tax=Viridothelium virens TaxID=1048519 RepID=A0A6A6HIM2_VIRVR|nr:hypothetical protein EV356DRAFT_573769 [Viridothelium virens]
MRFEAVFPTFSLVIASIALPMAADIKRADPSRIEVRVANSAAPGKRAITTGPPKIEIDLADHAEVEKRVTATGPPKIEVDLADPADLD